MGQCSARAVSASGGGDHNVYSIPAMRDPVLSFLEALVPAVDPEPKAKTIPVPRKLPALYRRTRALTAALFFVGLAAMYVDLYYSLTPLGVPVYLVWCLSCVSMFVTNHLAEREWKERNGQQRK